MKQLFIFFIVFFMTYWADAQVANSLRSDGKIYVLVSIILIIFLGIIIYLFRIDKKAKQLEKMHESKQKGV